MSHLSGGYKPANENNPGCGICVLPDKIHTTFVASLNVVAPDHETRVYVHSDLYCAFASLHRDCPYSGIKCIRHTYYSFCILILIPFIPGKLASYPTNAEAPLHRTLFSPTQPPYQFCSTDYVIMSDFRLSSRGKPCNLNYAQHIQSFAGLADQVGFLQTGLGSACQIFV
jgi:hypothetical protein